MTTLTFREGADGSRPSDAACVGVFIFDDSIPEDTERLSFHIRSLNTSVVRVVEGRAWKHVYIRDNDGTLHTRQYENILSYTRLQVVSQYIVNFLMIFFLRHFMQL